MHLSQAPSPLKDATYYRQSYYKTRKIAMPKNCVTYNQDWEALVGFGNRRSQESHCITGGKKRNVNYCPVSGFRMMDIAIRNERLERKRERYVVNGRHPLIVHPAFNDNVTHIAAGIDTCSVQRGRLSRRP